MSRRVLLTGAGGFCGSHILIHFLHNTDWHIIATDSFRHYGKTDRLTEMLDNHPEYKPRVTVLTHDLTVPFSEQFKAKLGKIDYIVNVASESHVDRSITEPREFVNNNVNLMHTMLEYARDCPVEKFLHISTDEVYGPALNGYNHIEGDYLRPSNPYAASKAMQEVLGHSYWRTYDIPYMQSNTMNIFAELQDPEKIIPKTIKCIVTGETMPIFGNKDKSAAGTRKYLHARNQADALMFILNNVEPTSYKKGDLDIPRFNVVGDREISNLDIALLVAEYAGKPLKYEMVDFYSARPGHDQRYSLDGTKMADLGWRAPMSFEDSLKSTVEWTLKNQDWLL